MKVSIPNTIKEAKAALGDLDDLITAREWQRAAVVYAFTRDTKGGRPGKNPPEFGQVSISEFTKLGIHGLRKRETVAAYRQAWEWAVVNGHAVDVEPGQKVTLPDVEWPGRQDDAGQRRYIEQDPSSIARAMTRGKVDVEAFAQDIDADTAAAIVGRLAEDRPAIIAEAVAQSAGAQRAIVRNDQAREKIGDQSIEHHARFLPDERLDPAKEGRKASEGVRHALGITEDEATSELRSAANLILQAMVWAEEFGITDEDAEERALKEVEKALRVYKARGVYTAADEAFLSEHGMVVE